MRVVLTVLIGLVVALSFTAAQWMQARRLRRAKPAPGRTSREFAG
jgi:hypothetical protein